MPYEKDVLERKTWWCPKLYWPFAVCDGIRTQHKWCYNFAWVKETRYGVVGHLEGCENGRLFTWTRAVLGVGSTTYPGGEMCFDSSRGADEGRCDSSRTGLLASGLSASDPYASSIDYDVLVLRSDVAEAGSFEFTGENERLCQKGLWPYERVLHEQVITASVATRFVTVQWYIGGMPTLSSAGFISLNANCHWPFPLPTGRSKNRVVQVRYEIITEANKSTLRIFNDPMDGSYSFSLGMSASENGKEYSSYYTSANFRGETCKFETEQVQQLAKCLRRFSDISTEKAKFKKPKLGEPVVIFSEEIWRFADREKMESVNSLVEIIRNSLHDEPQLFAQAVDQLEQQLGLAGAARLISIGSTEREAEHKPSEHLNGLGRSQPGAVALIALGIGLIIARAIVGPRSSGRNTH